MNKVELLAPAGTFEKMQMAFLYGADACYLGGKLFGLRAGAKNFDLEEISRAAEYAHERGKKIYVTVNIMAHNDDLEGLPEYLRKLYEVNVDAVLISDPGIFSIARREVPELEIHLSTQANATNYSAIEFWRDQGMKRAVVAREMSLKEISQVKDRVGDSIELESFVHGAMCVSYSGRCLLSSFMTGRDSNRGACSHPCRWQYYLVESTRPDEYYPIEEDEHGTHILNSKDLCMIEYIPELIKSGISSLKIEGRMKSAYYVATVVRAYRLAIDAYYEKGEDWRVDPCWLEEINKTSHRKFTTGFYFGNQYEKAQEYSTSKYVREYSFIGLIKDTNYEADCWKIEQRNKFSVGDEVEIISPGSKSMIRTRVLKIVDGVTGELREDAPHPQETLIVKFENTRQYDLKPDSIIRMAIGK
ncbi:MAG TPA: U32 family peptidase [Thermotogota bacterium]|nr:U32 family peptidase [Thermotogota bacterium]HPJ90194.1 U32 family peptidase [Thermotogota bacterium]HPR97420.1 U32 family peptidase [Thermotogota bacterium]